MEIVKPVRTTELKKLLDLPEPREGVERRLVAYFVEDGAGWYVVRVTAALSVEGHQPANLIKPPDTRKPLLLNYRGKPKLYKTMDALFRDMKSMIGNGQVVLYEVPQHE